MPFQSSKLTASGLRAGIAPMMLSGTKSKRPSNSRSLRRTSVSVRQAATVASSPLRGTHAGMAKRGRACPPITICEMSWGPAARRTPSAPPAAARTPPTTSATSALRRGLERGLNGLPVRSIVLGKGAEGCGRVDRPLGRQVEERRAARLHDLDVRDAAVGEDREHDGDGALEVGADLLIPEDPDLLLHAREVEVAARLRSFGDAGTGRAELEPGSLAGCRRSLGGRGGLLGLAHPRRLRLGCLLLALPGVELGQSPGRRFLLRRLQD